MEAHRMCNDLLFKVQSNLGKDNEDDAIKTSSS